MPRTGTGTLIARLRRLVNDGTLGLWQDEELQDVLDQHKQRVHREPLGMERTLLSSGSAEYRIYHSRYGNLEAGGGTAYFQLEDSSGTQRGTADYTADYIDGVVTMAADQLGTALYLSGWTYDLNGAAADLWRERAGQLAERVDARTGDNSLQRSQMVSGALKMAEHYAQQSRARTVRSWNVGILERK